MCPTLGQWMGDIQRENKTMSHRRHIHLDVRLMCKHSPLLCALMVLDLRTFVFWNSAFLSIID